MTNVMKPHDSSSKNKLAIWGASGHALVIADMVRLRDDYTIACFIDDLHPELDGTVFAEALVVAGPNRLDDVRRLGVDHVIIGIGDCETRLRLADVAKNHGFELAYTIHPSSVLAGDVSIGAGTVMAAGTVINPGCKIGRNVIINTGATVDHECIIEDGAHICPGVHLAGNVSVGRGAWVGIGATVINRIRIGAGSVIGAGAVVVRNIPDNVTAYGVPARIVRKASSSEIC